MLFFPNSCGNTKWNKGNQVYVKNSILCSLFLFIEIKKCKENEIKINDHKNQTKTKRIAFPKNKTYPVSSVSHIKIDDFTAAIKRHQLKKRNL